MLLLTDEVSSDHGPNNYRAIIGMPLIIIQLIELLTLINTKQTEKISSVQSQCYALFRYRDGQLMLD